MEIKKKSKFGDKKTINTHILGLNDIGLWGYGS
jgi:hypothetical protein